jgi:hypothetical protein
MTEEKNPNIVKMTIRYEEKIIRPARTIRVKVTESPIHCFGPLVVREGKGALAKPGDGNE